MNELSVLISGASSGIGEACALLLSRNDFQVFAGVRNQADGHTLQEKVSGKLTPLLLDVTDPTSIQNARDVISESNDSNLFALINNAGLGLGGPAETLQEADVRRLFEVNVLGVFALTSAFIPLLRKGGGGRIINMGSMSGILALPGMSAYAASKHALEAITDSLRLELNPFNISVSIIEPGNVETPIWEKGLVKFNKMLSRTEDSVSQLYAHLNSQLIKYSQNPDGIPPVKVATLVHQVLVSNKPKNRYLIGKDAVFFKLIGSLPGPIRDRIILRLMKN